jgi:hypothetical protein
MKFFGLLLLVTLSCNSLSALAAAVQDAAPQESSWAVGDISANQRVWKQEVTRETENGPVTETRSFVELADGLYYWRNEQWNESKDEIELMAQGGAAATKGPHQAIFAANVNTIGAITLHTPNGTALRSHVSALSFTDEDTGQSVLLG